VLKITLLKIKLSFGIVKEWKITNLFFIIHRDVPKVLGHCDFLLLNRELIKIIDYKIMLKLQCKTTFNPVFVGKKIIKIEQESTLE
jgi:hypothetical protein